MGSSGAKASPVLDPMIRPPRRSCYQPWGRPAARRRMSRILALTKPAFWGNTELARPLHLRRAVARAGAISTATLSLLSLGRIHHRMPPLGGRGEDIAFAAEMIDANDSKNALFYHPIQDTLDQARCSSWVMAAPIASIRGLRLMIEQFARRRRWRSHHSPWAVLNTRELLLGGADPMRSYSI